MDKPIAKLKLLTTEGKVVDAILYCHQETTTIAGTTYYLLKLNTPADASGTTLSASTASVARVVWGKFVYQLTGIAKILASTIYATYRAYTGGGTVNAEIDILILKADGTVRTTIATGVSKSSNLGSSWTTYTGANYSFADYQVVDQTDYLEIDYIANVTAKKATQYAYLRIDDNTLATSDQTRSQEWKFTGVTTLSAIVTSNSATLNGQINGTETLTIRGFEWGTQSGNYTGSWTESGAFPPDTFSYNLTNLSPGTAYYFRAKAYSDATGWIYGNEVAFTTLSILPVGWSYRKSHVINPASGAGTNYQVRIVAHYGSGTDSGADVYLNGKCRTDFGDIRFTLSDGVSLLDYWMESYTASDNAVFWVEVADDLSTNPATIYIYYGNATATTTSNGTATFQSFRNLVADEYASWGAVSLTTYANGNDPGDCFLSSTQVDTVYLSPCIYFRYYGGKKWSLDSSKIHFEAYSDGGNSGECGQDIRMRTSAAPTGWQTSNAYTANATLNRKHILVIDYQMLSGSGGLTYYLDWSVGDDIPSGTVAKSTTLSSASRVQIEDVYMGLVSHIKIAAIVGASIDLYAVYHCVAKYVSPEPSHGSWGSEETVAVAEAIVAKNFPMDYLPSPIKAQQLTSKVSGATITKVSQEYPSTALKKDKAAQLTSKWT